MDVGIVNPLGRAHYQDGGGPNGGAASTHHYGQNWQSSQAFDMFVPPGTPVYAPVDGTVVRAKIETYHGAIEGLEVGIDGMGAGRSAFLGHLSRIAEGVTVGRVVKKGDYLGESGNYTGVTGAAPAKDWALQVIPFPPPTVGAHLHFALSAPGQRYDDEHETRDVDVVGLVKGAPFSFIPRPNAGGIPQIVAPPAPVPAQVPVSIGDAWGTLRQALAGALPNAAQVLYEVKARIIRASQ